MAKLAENDELRQYVQDRLGGIIARPDGKLVPGPQVRWVGRRHGPRKDRRWATSWSPEQISNRLRIDFPDDGPHLMTGRLGVPRSTIYGVLTRRGLSRLLRFGPNHRHTDPLCERLPR